MSAISVAKGTGDSHDSPPPSPVSASSSILFDESRHSGDRSISSPLRDIASSPPKSRIDPTSSGAASLRPNPAWPDTLSAASPPLHTPDTVHGAPAARAEVAAQAEPAPQTPIRHIGNPRKADPAAVAIAVNKTAVPMNGSKRRDPAAAERKAHSPTAHNESASSNSVTTNSSNFTRSGTAPTTPQRERFTDIMARGGHRANQLASASAAAPAGPSHSPASSDASSLHNAAVAAEASPTSLSASEWAESIALSYFTCALCRRLVRDPVQVYPEPILACRACAEARHGTNRLNVQELPANVIRAMREIVERVELFRAGAGGVLRKMHSNELPDAAVAKRRVIHVKRGYREVEGEAAAARIAAAAAAASEVAKLGEVNLVPAGRAGLTAAAAQASRSAARHVDVNSADAVAAHAATFTQSEKEKGEREHTSGHKEQRHGEEAANGKEDEEAAAEEDVIRVGGRTPSQAAAAQRLLAAMLQQLIEAELSERNQIVAAQLKTLSELEKHARIRRPRTASDGPTSRQMKIEADKLYESANYAQALQMYNKSIELQRTDQLTQLKFLYGNRSAANFMAHNYEACVADCLEVVRLEPENKKMLSRAARASATMGDLAQAVRIFESTTPREAMTEAMQSELTKYKQGLAIQQKVEQHFGTPEADEQLRMLIAQFTDTIAFRVRHAESLIRQKQHLRALESLEVVSASSRTATVARLMAECLYMSGFEHFDRARKLLKDYVETDPACAQLHQLIERVENGKQNGNNNFAQKNFSAAVQCYTTAIQHAAQNDQILRILYCNRAAANKEIGRYRDGVEDCTRALAIDPDFFKAYARRARCHQHLGDYFAAVQDFKKALTFEAGDHELAKELRTAEYQLAKETEREKDYYYQLGVTRMATEREIKLKFRELSLRWHPDKCVGLSESERARAEHKFKVISEAHTVLSDPVRRREFDLKLDRARVGRAGYGGLSTASFGTGTEGAFRSAKHRSGPGGFW